MSKKSSNPRDRLGVFRRYADVPPRYRLGQYEAEYADRDMCEEFVESREFDHDADHYHPPLQAARTYPTAREVWETAYGLVEVGDD